MTDKNVISRAKHTEKMLLEYPNTILNVHKQADYYPDSIELGEAKSRIKVYFNASDRDESERRIANAMYLKAFGEDVHTSFASGFRPEGNTEHIAEMLAKILELHDNETNTNQG